MNRKAFALLLTSLFFVAVTSHADEYHVVELIDHTPRNAAIRSALVPGWGQSFNGEKRKGVLLFGTTAAAAALSIYFHEKANDSYDDYVASGRAGNSNYDDYSRENTLTWAFGSVAAFTWIYSVFNAGRRGSQLSAQAAPIALSFNAEQGMVRWQKEF
jgi:hypothetical protein